MENKDKVIRELQEKILLLESKVEYLQGILLDANIPYEVSPNSETNSSVADNDINQGARIIQLLPENSELPYSPKVQSL